MTRLLLVLIAVLAGCGQKGPLYFAEPETGERATSAAERSPASVATDVPDDDEADADTAP